jgi:hypothetical protein
MIFNILVLSAVAICSAEPAAAKTGWSAGHVGIDRPGSDFKLLDCGNQTATCCFEHCMQEDKCEAWSFELRNSKCHLKNTVPTQSMAQNSDGTASITSGVKKAAAEGLLPLKYTNFPLGATSPSGWLRTQLQLVTNGLSGHLELFWDDIADSVWIGGEHDHSGAGHERGPYWLNGVVPLSAHLNASGDTKATTLNVDLQGQVNRWVYYILDHQNKTTGWLGPDDGFGGAGNTYWNGWNIAAALLQYADARAISDPIISARCNKAVLSYITCVHGRMLTVPFSAWSQNRWQDWAYIVHWLLDQAPQGQEQLLWDAAELTQQQSWDWDAYYDQTGTGTTGAFVGKTMPKFPAMNVGGWSMYDHGVNNAMGTKSCTTWYRQSRNESDAKAAYKKLLIQDKYHGQPHGMFAADECFGGRELNRGIELCAVVEQMYSLQHNFRVLGDPYFLDRYERIAFNSLPGTISPDQWQHQYLQQANEINAKYGLKQHVWQTDGADSTGMGVAPNFGCCTANINQGWSKFTSNVFLQSPSDKGVVIAVIAPASVTTKDGSTVSITTDYPFGDDATITAISKSAAFPLHIRIPGFADSATISVDGGAPTSAKNGTLFTVAIAAGKSSKISIDLKPQIRLEKEWGLSPTPLPTPIAYSAGGAAVPSASTGATGGASDWSFSGGAGVSNSKMAGDSDIRSGEPGGVSMAILNHPLYGEGHAITKVSLAFQYLAGYSPPKGQTKVGSTLSVHLVATNHTIIKTLYTSSALDKYSFDHGDPYSPPISVVADGLNVPNGEPLMIALKFTNNQRNLQVPLLDKTGMSVSVEWGATKAPGPAPMPPSSTMKPGTAAVAVLRGPLLYTLLLKETVTSVIKTWAPFNNTDVNLESPAPWNYALLLDDAHPLQYVKSSLGPNKAIPFNTSNYFATIQASARALPGWLEKTNAADEPPASPLDCKKVDGGCGPEVKVTLVPYGSTNLRMSGLPWIGATGSN